MSICHRAVGVQVLSLLACLVTSCTSVSKEIRPSIVLILDQIEAYEQALNIRLAAEEHYYAAHAATLDKATRQASLIARDVRQRQLIFAYVDAAHSDGQVLRLSRLMQLLSEADDEVNVALMEFIRLSTEQRMNTSNSFAALETKRAELAKVRTALESMLQDESLAERLKFWSDYFGRVNTEISKARTRAGQGETSNKTTTPSITPTVTPPR